MFQGESNTQGELSYFYLGIKIGGALVSLFAILCVSSTYSLCLVHFTWY